MRARDGWLMATGTLTVLRVPPPGRVDRHVAGVALSVAPLAVAPLAAAAALTALLGDRLGLPGLVTAFAVVAVLGLGTRALHWDGLADTADGLTASYDPRRSLEVMRDGACGPAGVLAVVLVVGLQASALAPLVRAEHGWLAVGLAVCASRASLVLACVRGVPAARAEGLGALHVGSVPVVAALVTLLVAGLLVTGAALLVAGSVWIGLVGWLALVAGVLALVGRSVARLGGVTGDVLGAAVEGGLAVLLVSLAAGA